MNRNALKQYRTPLYDVMGYGAPHGYLPQPATMGYYPAPTVATPGQAAVAFGEPRGPEPRVGFVGLGVHKIEGGKTVCIKTTFQTVGKCNRLWIPKSVASNFAVQSIKFGIAELLVGGCGAVPAEVYSEESEDSTFDGEPVTPGMEAQLLITNLSEQCQTFKAGFRMLYGV